MRTGIISLALALCGCADEWELDYERCHPEGDCFFSRAEWEEIQTFAMVEEPVLRTAGMEFKDLPLAEAVGRAIFFDDELGPHQVSCATCHPPEGWFTAPKTRRESTSDEFRGITSVVDAALYATHSWHGGKQTLWELTQVPLEKASLMGGNRIEIAQHVYEADYGPYFIQLFGRIDLSDIEGKHGLPEAVDKDRVGDWEAIGEDAQGRVDDVFKQVAYALEAYMRTMIAGPTPFDAYATGSFEELDEGEKRGLRVFIGKGHCSACHSGSRLTDDAFHNIGLAIAPEEKDRASALAPEEKDRNIVEQNYPLAVGAFRTPTLRNVAMTPPYLHTSEYDRLEQVVWHYRDTTEAREGFLDTRMWETDLTDAEIEDLVAFLETLTSTSCPWMPGEICPPPPL